MISKKAHAPAPDTPPSIGVKKAALLQLAPGIASLPVFIILASLLTGSGIPNIFALALTILFVEVPVSWAIMARQVRNETGARLTIAKAFPWTAAIPWWQYLIIGLPVMVFSMVMVAGVDPKIGAKLLSGIFSWVPQWLVLRPDPTMFSGLSREMAFVLCGLMLFAMVLAGGFTQELYSRGFLLPRMSHLGNWAPAYNALLFAVFHLIAPWSWGTFFLMVLPWAYLVWWRRSIKIGLFIHVGMLALQWLAMTLVIFGVVQAP